MPTRQTVHAQWAARVPNHPSRIPLDRFRAASSFLFTEATQRLGHPPSRLSTQQGMSNSRKRARPDADDDVCTESKNSATLAPVHPLHSITHDPEFWFPDGNIILVARAVGFRVYQGLLAYHSPVFSDMFSLPQHTLPQPSLSQPDGVPSVTPNGEPPLVHIADSPEDLRHVLRACMPRTSAS